MDGHILHCGIVSSFHVCYLSLSKTIDKYRSCLCVAAVGAKSSAFMYGFA